MAFWLYKHSMYLYVWLYPLFHYFLDQYIMKNSKGRGITPCRLLCQGIMPKSIPYREGSRCHCDFCSIDLFQTLYSSDSIMDKFLHSMGCKDLRSLRSIGILYYCVDIIKRSWYSFFPFDYKNFLFNLMNTLMPFGFNCNIS